jgi:Tfp pilus assembly protein PilO
MTIVSGKITKQDWIFVGIVLLLTSLLFIGFYFLGYRKMQDEIQARTDVLNTTRQELKQARALEAGIEALRTESKEMAHLVEVFEKRLPEEREIPALLGRFERLGGEIGLRVQLSSLPTSKSGNMEVIPYKAVAVGQFHQVATFINMLERDERYLKVTDVDIGEETDSVSQATFVLSTFRFISEPEAKNE